MKKIGSALLYFFFGISERKRKRKKNKQGNRVSDFGSVVPNEAYDLFPHIDFVFER